MQPKSLLELLPDAQYQRSTLERSLQLTAESMRHYGMFYRHWCAAFSGGKDSSATVTAIAHLIKSGEIPAPERLTVLYADTRQELPPLHFAAMKTLDKLKEFGCETKIVLPEIDKRFWIYILGRGVPSPNNGTMRWCTGQIKVNPMTASLEQARSQLRPEERLLMITGVRKGESAARDQRISVSCTKDGGECGQGWFQQMTTQGTEDLAAIDTLAPILHWRVCHVWDWLTLEAPAMGFDTWEVAEAYGMGQTDGEEDLSARTGCMGCPLVSSDDDALSRIVKNPKWAYLEPLKGLRQIHREIRDFRNRLRMDGSETKKDGSLVKNPGRVGPLTLEAREMFLERVLGIQNAVNRQAIATGRPEVSLINDEEESRIKELISLKTFPNKWTGDEISGAALIPEVYQDGSVQQVLFEGVW